MLAIGLTLVRVRGQSSIGGPLFEGLLRDSDMTIYLVPFLRCTVFEGEQLLRVQGLAHIRGGERQAGMGSSDRKARRNIRTKRATEDEDEEGGSKEEKKKE